jgi:hypothetical protein
MIRIISQKNDKIIEANAVVRDYNEITAYTNGLPRGIRVGYYKSEERAIEVFDECLDNIVVENYFDMPEV